MSEHLSSEQIAAWTIGDRTAEAAQHVRVCAECERRVEELQQTLSMFRGAVRETAGSFEEQQRVFRVPRRRMAVLWATVAAAGVTLAMVPVYERQKAAQTARQDAELLEQVNADLSEDVAGPMKPLERMVSWGPAAKSAAEKRTF